MTDTAKKRLAIDLDEIERQLRLTAPQNPAPQNPAARNDPLAELARVVGQEDPFRSILSGERAGVEPRRANPEADDIFALGPDQRSAARDDYRQQLYGQPDQAPAHDHGQQDYDEPAYHEPAYHEPAQPQTFDAYIDEAGDPRYAQAPKRQDVYADDLYADPAYASQTAYGQRDEWREPQAYAEPEQYDDHYDDDGAYDRVPPRRSRKAMLTVGAVLGVAVLGVASALVFSGGGSGLVDGEPPVVSAGTEPIKIAPENPGGVEIPNQNRQIFGGATDGETQIVDREEQPVDIGEVAREAPRVILPAPAGVQGRAEDDPINQVLAGLQPAEGLQAPSAVSTAVAALGEPRRVRTVSVRPDGTIIGNTNATQAQPAPLAINDLTSTQPFQSQTSATAEPVPVQETARQEATAQPEPVAPTGPLALTGAMPPTPQREAPARQEAPREVASISAPATTATTAAPTGGYAVQLAIRDTEERAFQAFSQYQTRYAGIIGNVDPIVRRAEVNGNTIYRIRVGPYALGEANTICERIKGSGGDCFVARN